MQPFSRLCRSSASRVLAIVGAFFVTLMSLIRANAKIEDWPGGADARLNLARASLAGVTPRESVRQRAIATDAVAGVPFSSNSSRR